jgi:hypothetical protein
MNIVRVTGCAPGTVDFQYSFPEDIVIARSRWSIDTPAEVMCWYELHARYLTARFSRSKDLITVQDKLDVSPKVIWLWERYFVRLHEDLLRFSAIVGGKAWSRLALAGSRVDTIESATLADAMAAIRARRKAAVRPSPMSLIA